uniref:Uncharacterized protein n=1 Tax=Corvus moneduloides TaxID=1196302 RepID=A0A8C3ESS0_CORMO
MNSVCKWGAAGCLCPCLFNCRIPSPWLLHVLELVGKVGQLDTTCHAFVGETVVLPCTTTPPGDLTLAKSMLYWQIGTKIVHFFQKGQDSLKAQDEHFHGRTSLFLDQMEHGNLSLKISNVQLEDNAEYTCIYRQTGGHETKKSKIRLNVSGKDPPSPSGKAVLLNLLSV